MRRAAILVVLALLALAQRSAAEATVRASLDRSTVSVGESAVLTLTIEGAGGLDQDPVFDPPEGLHLREGGQSRSYSLVDGRFSQSVEIRYLFTPLREGTFEVGPIELQVSGRIHRVGPFRIVARRTGGAPPGTGRERGSEDAPLPVLVRLEAEPPEVWVGEQVTVTSSFWKHGDVVVTDARFVPPEGEGFWKEDLPPERRGIRNRSGVAYEVTEIRSAFFPTRAGSLSIGPARVEVRYREPSRDRRDPFFPFGMLRGGREREGIPSSQVATVRARPLPEPAPEGFSGAVGRFQIRSVVEAEEPIQGEPIPWTIVITGEGNLGSAEPPPLPEIPGCRVFEAGTEVETTRANDRIGGTKRISRVLIPESAGPLTVPSMTWSCFDPEEGRYVTRELPRTTVRVSAAAADPEGGAARIGGAIRPVRTRGALAPISHHRPWTSFGFWATQAIPLAALAVAFAWKRRREDLERDPVGARLRTAPRRFRRALAEVPKTPDPWGALGRALEETLADRYGTAVVGMPRPALRNHLLDRGCDPSSVERVLVWLERAQRARYAPGGEEAGEELTRAVAEAAEIVDRLGGRRRG